MQWQDIADTFKEYGYLGPVLTIPGLFGVGSQTYGSTPSKTSLKAPVSSRASGRKSIGTKIYH